MKLEQSFEVAAPLERVWRALIDVEHVAPCLPGATVTGRNDDGSYTGSLTIKIGPTTAAYAGKLEMETIDEANHSAVMQAQGTDKRGQGGAKATISSSLRPGEGGITHVDVVTDYHITGRLARFGRGGMIEDISERLLKQFAQSLQDSLTGDGDAGEPAETAAPAGAAAAADTAAPAGAAAADTAAPTETAAPAQAAAPDTPPPVAEPETPPPAAEPKAPRPAAQPKAAEPLDAVPLVASVVRSRAQENPAPLIALVVGFVLALIVFRRRGRK